MEESRKRRLDCEGRKRIGSEGYIEVGGMMWSMGIYKRGMDFAE